MSGNTDAAWMFHVVHGLPGPELSYEFRNSCSTSFLRHGNAIVPEIDGEPDKIINQPIRGGLLHTKAKSSTRSRSILGGDGELVGNTRWIQMKLRVYFRWTNFWNSDATSFFVWNSTQLFVEFDDYIFMEPHGVPASNRPCLPWRRMAINLKFAMSILFKTLTECPLPIAWA